MKFSLTTLEQPVYYVAQAVASCPCVKKMCLYWEKKYTKKPGSIPTEFMGSVALLWRNTKRNVNPRLSYFELCLSACVRLLANSHLHLHSAFSQSKVTLP